MLFVCFERFERRIFVCVMIRRENVSTIMTGEKRAPLGSAGLVKIEKKFL